MRADMYKKMSEIPGVSQRLSMKKYLGLNDEEIKENKKYWEREQIDNAKFNARIKEIEKGKSKKIDDKFDDNPDSIDDKIDSGGGMEEEIPEVEEAMDDLDTELDTETTEDKDETEEV